MGMCEFWPLYYENGVLVTFLRLSKIKKRSSPTMFVFNIYLLKEYITVIF